MLCALFEGACCEDTRQVGRGREVAVARSAPTFARRKRAQCITNLTYSTRCLSLMSLQCLQHFRALSEPSVSIEKRGDHERRAQKCTVSRTARPKNRLKRRRSRYKYYCAFLHISLDPSSVLRRGLPLVPGAPIRNLLINASLYPRGT